MSGVTKHIYDAEICDILSMWSAELKTIRAILPQYYQKQDIIASVREYYPHEWNGVRAKYDYYTQKDCFLVKCKRKPRYNMKKPEDLICDVPLFRKLMNREERAAYASSYSLAAAETAEMELRTKRAPKIARIDRKIAHAKEKTQQMTPAFIDALIGMYECKRTSQKNRVYLLHELEKYYNEKVIQFFFKLNDTELNEQLRREAFEHLQGFSFQPRFRRTKYMQVHTKNKKRMYYLKKVYPYEKYEIAGSPEELEYRINNNAEEQLIKEYDYFISHSYKDSAPVQKLIEKENAQGKNVFCDWINDADYLKRTLVCAATLRVIETRMQQSKALLFVDSEHSRASVWCKYELNFYQSLGKPIMSISIEDIEKDTIIVSPLSDKWFFDPDYKKTVLIPQAAHSSALPAGR